MYGAFRKKLEKKTIISQWAHGRRLHDDTRLSKKRFEQSKMNEWINLIDQ